MADAATQKSVAAHGTDHAAHEEIFRRRDYLQQTEMRLPQAAIYGASKSEAPIMR